MPTIFRNAKLFDGNGSRLFSRAVAVEDDRILDVANQPDSRPDDAVIDCAGAISKSLEISLNESVLEPGASHKLLYTEEELMATGEQAQDVSILQDKDHLAVIYAGRPTLQSPQNQSIIC